MQRRHFIGSAAATLGLAGCSAGPTTSAGATGPILNPPPTATPGPAGATPPTVATPTGGTLAADLRFGQAPIPATSTATGYDPAGDAKALMAATVPSPATSPVPGTQLIGSYATDEQYVIRVPTAWNGALVVCGTPATRSAFASDLIWGDFLLANGYAFAASNKGIPYNAVAETIANSQNTSTAYPFAFNLAGLEGLGYTYRLGALTPNAKPISGWNTDFAKLTVAAQAYLTKNFKAPRKTYAVGISNGGAQVRSLIETYPQLVDGGVDWEGVLWRPYGSFLDYMPVFLKAMQRYVASGFTDANAAATIVAAGYPPDLLNGSAAHPSLWFDYYAGTASFYTDLTVFEYALLIDPNASSSIAPAGCTPNAANPAQLPGTCAATGLGDPQARANYVPSAAARANIASFAHTGNVRKPLISIGGSADMFITVANNMTPYLAMAQATGNAANVRQYVVSGGTHVDTFPAFGYAGMQPQAPFAWAAFNQLVAWVERGYNVTPGIQTTVTSPAQIASS